MRNKCMKGYTMNSRGSCVPVKRTSSKRVLPSTGGNNVMDWGNDCCATGCTDFYARVTCGTQTVTCQLPEGCTDQNWTQNLWDQGLNDLIFGGQGNFQYEYGEEFTVPDYSFEGVDVGDMPYSLQCWGGCQYSGGSMVSACLGVGQIGQGYGSYSGQACGNVVRCNCNCNANCGATGTITPGGPKDVMPFGRGGSIKMNRRKKR